MCTLAVPIVDRDKIMDHICFPHLFCTGKGGMYDDYNILIIIVPIHISNISLEMVDIN
jgi:hypothetical protein